MKILEPRDNLENISMSPEDEFTLFFYIGEDVLSNIRFVVGMTFGS